MDPSDPGIAADAEVGTSLVRTGPEVAALRRALERPARAGRYMLLLLGAIALGAGVAVYLTNTTVLGLAFAAFGVVLLALGGVQHFLLRRDLRNWPQDALLFEEGIEIVLANGEIRVLPWTDPKFSLALVSRKAPAPANREFLLVWLAEGKIPSIEISEEGFDAVIREVAARRLIVQERRRGKGEAAGRWIAVSAGFASQPLQLDGAPDEQAAETTT
jgi:hypothetical protein